MDPCAGLHILAHGSIPLPYLPNLCAVLRPAPLASYYFPFLSFPLLSPCIGFSLDPNNYRGITLLSTFCKLFEIVLWNRLKRWWVNEGVISELQGAFKTGMSCVHIAFSSQEAIAMWLEEGNKCYVVFYDVSKAFDAVWIDGLYRQVFDMGITGINRFMTWELPARRGLTYTVVMLTFHVVLKFKAIFQTGIPFMGEFIRVGICHCSNIQCLLIPY